MVDGRSAGEPGGRQRGQEVGDDCGAVVVVKTGRKPLPPHWYKRLISECPVCGRGRDERVRMLTPKPEDPSETIEYDGLAYDHCLEYAL